MSPYESPYDPSREPEIRASFDGWTPAEGEDWQRAMAERVVPVGDAQGARTVAGVAVAYERGRRHAWAAAVALTYPGLEPVASALADAPVSLPYIPDELSLREVPVALAALAELAASPDVLVADGPGLAHPRRFGLACHLGVATGVPTVGIARVRSCGTHEEVGLERGARVPLVLDGSVAGEVVRTRTGVRPVYVSVGHLLSLAAATRFALALTPRFRLPETTRRAGRLAGEAARSGGGTAPR